jgi:hypothetical protein
MPQRASVFTYSRLKASNSASVNGVGERSSQAANALAGRPRPARWRSTRAKPSASGSGRARRARSISNPASAATPLEYWNTAGM